MRPALAFLLALAGCRQLLGLAPPELVDAQADAPAGPHVSSPRKLSLPSDVSITMPQPILVVLDATRIDYSAIHDPTTDIEFYDPTYAVALPFEVEQWDPGGRSYLWVGWGNVDGLPSPRFVHMMFGPNVRGAQLPTAPWDMYELVHHFMPSLQSSTASLYPGVMIGASLAPMMIGQGIQLAGTGAEEVTFDLGQLLFDHWPAFTLELWIRPDYQDPSSVTGQSVLEQGGGFVGSSIAQQNGIVSVGAEFIYANNADTKLDVATPLGEWTYAVWTYDGEHQMTYRNGVPTGISTQPGGFALADAKSSFHVGSLAMPMFGAIDELRIAQRTFPADYFRVQYLSGMDQLLTFGDAVK